MLTLSHEEKLKLMSSLNWDYLDKPEDMLAVNVASAATTVFLEQAVREKRMPFTMEADSCWSKKNQDRLQESLHEIMEGKVVVKTTEELEVMENG